MYIVHVFVHVKEEWIEDFITETTENAKISLQESGIAKFDIIQQQDDPTRIVLIEVYRTYEDPGRHKQTEHYNRWRDSVAHMMEEPRTSIKYYNVFPEDGGWD